MLATIENNALINVGITKNIGRFLPKGPLIEGKMFLISAKMHSALARLDKALFVDALQDKIAYYAYVQSIGAESPDDGNQFNHGQIPAATKEQQIALIELAEQLVLLYSANSILRNEVAEVSSLVPKIFESSSFTVRPDFLNRLQCDGHAEDLYRKVKNHTTALQRLRQALAAVRGQHPVGPGHVEADLVKWAKS